MLGIPSYRCVFAPKIVKHVGAAPYVPAPPLPNRVSSNCSPACRKPKPTLILVANH